MGFFIVRRIGQTLIVLAIASIIVFTLMRLIPGDPIQVIMTGVSMRKKRRPSYATSSV